jgi:4-amino-4-deoxy-L-arabinose transferase-like glycosyltransferase
VTAKRVGWTAVLVAYCATRLALLPRFPPFEDETGYATWLERMHENVHNALLSVSYDKQPLFIWLGYPIRLFGFDPIVSLRFVSFVAGIVTLVFTALLARRLGGPRAALPAAALYVVLPFVFVHDVLALMDTLVSTIVVVGLWLELELARRQTLRVAVALGVVFGAGLLTKMTSVVVIALAPLTLVLFPWDAPERRRRLLRWAGAFVLALVIARAMYEILALSPDYARMAEIAKAIHQQNSIGDVLRHPLRYLDRNLPDLLRAYRGYLTWPIVALIAVGVVTAVRAERGRLALVYAAAAVGPLALAAFFAVGPFPRYVVDSVPPLVTFAAVGLVRVADVVNRRLPIARARLALVAVVLFAAFASSAVAFDARVEQDPNRAQYPAMDDFQFAQGWPSGNGWVAFIAELRRRAPHGATVAYATDVTFSAVVTLRLREPDYRFVDSASPEGRAAPLLVESLLPPNDRGYGTLRPVWQYRRPRGGPPVTLYRRLLHVHGVRVATPRELRGVLGLSPAAFAHWLASRPHVRAWAEEQPH